MLNVNHRKLEVWSKSIDFTLDIYKTTGSFPKSEVYGLTSQLRRAAVSIPSNIAEGASRRSPQERNRFYEIARSSLVEIDTQLEIATRLNYSAEQSIQSHSETMNHLFAMLSNLIKNTN